MTTRKNLLRILKGSELYPLTLSFREFLIDCQSRNLSPGTLRFYRQKLEPLLAYLGAQGIPEPGQVEPRHLRRFFSWLHREGEIDSNPMQRLKAPSEPEEPLAPASVHQNRAMLSVCDRKTEMGARDHSLILALADTGARAARF